MKKQMNYLWAALAFCFIVAVVGWFRPSVNPAIFAKKGDLIITHEKARIAGCEYFYDNAWKCARVEETILKHEIPSFKPATGLRCDSAYEDISLSFPNRYICEHAKVIKRVTQ